MRWLSAAGAFLFALAAPVAVRAQQTTEFVPVDPNELGRENLPAASMVMTAYALVWLVLLAYVWSLRRRQARVELEIASLRSRVSDTRPSTK